MATTKKSTSSRGSATATRRKRTASSSTRGGRKRAAGSPRRSRSSSPDGLALLKDDHQEVERLFKSFEKLGPGAHKSRQQTVDKVIEALSRHAAIEEQVFYPYVRRIVPDVTSDVLEALEEHHIVKWTLSELEDMDPGDERFGAKMAVLMESVRHHVKEEETELFPQVRKALSRDQLEELGVSLAAAKSGAPTRPHPRSPDTPPGNLLSQALTAPMDVTARLSDAASRKVRDIVS
jgi:hemerythrin-like domain-containing protein